MNEEQNSILSEEIKEIINSRFQYINKNYIKVRNAYKNNYGSTELDPLRCEISLCIILGLCQAAIALTNHLLESLLKYALITRHSENKKTGPTKTIKPIVTTMIETDEEGRKLYENANLDKTINRACTLGLISKEQKKHLHEFRERFRNAYSHADKRKTFGNSSMPVTGFRIEPDGLKADETRETKIAEFLPVQGIFQAEIAHKEAPQYFLYIDSLAREILDKLHGPRESSE